MPITFSSFLSYFIFSLPFSWEPWLWMSLFLFSLKPIKLCFLFVFKFCLSAFTGSFHPNQYWGCFSRVCCQRGAMCMRSCGQTQPPVQTWLLASSVHSSMAWCHWTCLRALIVLFSVCFFHQEFGCWCSNCTANQLEWDGGSGRTKKDNRKEDQPPGVIRFMQRERKRGKGGMKKGNCLAVVTSYPLCCRVQSLYQSAVSGQNWPDLYHHHHHHILL